MHYVPDFCNRPLRTSTRPAFPVDQDLTDLIRMRFEVSAFFAERRQVLRDRRRDTRLAFHAAESSAHAAGTHVGNPRRIEFLMIHIDEADIWS